VILVGEEVTLRPFRQFDSRRVFELVKDPEVLQYTLLPSSYRFFDAQDFIMRSNIRWRDSVLTFGIIVNCERYLAGVAGIECDFVLGKAELG